MTHSTEIKSAIYKDEVVKKHWQVAMAGQDPISLNEVIKM